ncbi:non-ribosomal peptide synthetase [Clostridium beijerinckii]|uniref:Amino acid adenylation domain-containing protein/thioester reductase-like protein n=1 Tax=Clostridium beijerinckii TaxID=1520 RepID=A0AAX0B0V0_CLOBE|nr:non-ribosomal peptide synthetase [Clostridium beijerinckii]NRT88955.1 amino acid adenylation domain-containing protein/thioester reductase-like protein [Clostridium beijerinckii]NYC74410.1 amino acid adenylation domain-containing protein/thioester reductase-like protein [Clostridium beijerinckii]
MGQDKLKFNSINSIWAKNHNLDVTTDSICMHSLSIDKYVIEKKLKLAQLNKDYDVLFKSLITVLFYRYSYSKKYAFCTIHDFGGILPTYIDIDSNSDIHTIIDIVLNESQNQEYFSQKINGYNSNKLMFNLIMLSNSHNDINNIKIKLNELGISFDNTDICIQYNESETYINIDFIYSSKKAHKEYIEQFCNSFKFLIDSFPENIKIPIINIDIFQNTDRNKILSFSCGKKVEYNNNISIIDLFEEQVKKTYDNTAVIFDNKKICYGELNEKANSLSKELNNIGIKKGQFVPVLSQNSFEYITSIIALMKIGAIFIPIDTNWSQNRISLIFDELKPQLILTNSDIDIEKYSKFQFYKVDYYKLICDKKTYRNEVYADDEIYGFYTSGSTGIPKCTININRGLVNRFTYMTRKFAISEKDVILQNSKIAFDSSMWQLIWPLLNGASVVIPKLNGIFDLEGIINIINKYKVTMTDFVPSIFNILVDYMEVNRDVIHKMESLRYLLIGGEEINVERVCKFRKIIPHIILINTYGPTETSIGMVFYNICNNYYEQIPIGKPIDNTCALVLDESLNIVPLGVVGEICVGGDCMGKGYLNDIEKTKTLFIEQHPFKQIAGKYIYKTGDFGYMKPNGNLYFVGRRDKQVKINGVRVELGEIENILLKHPDIKDAKVLLNSKIIPGKDELIAFVVSKKRIGENNIKDYMGNNLPKYMIPKYIKFLEEMPLNNNGKVDLAQLSNMNIRDKKTTDISFNYSNDEKKLIDICCKLLNNHEISINDDFFELGGDSLLAVQLLCEIKRNFGVDVEVGEIYKCSNLKLLLNNINDMRLNNNNMNNNNAIDIYKEMFMLNEEVSADFTFEKNTNKTKKNFNDLSNINVMLTGSTGFIGVHLLNELINNGYRKIYCLIREKNINAARDKLIRSLELYKLEYMIDWDHVEIVLGDLSKKQFGMELEKYNELAQEIDIIIHNGAVVNFVLNYQQIKQTNVLGTVEIIKFAKTSIIKPIQYISTLSVLPLDEEFKKSKKLKQNYPLYNMIQTVSGYSLSKWISEQIINGAKKFDIPINIYRLGEIMAHSKIGIPNKKALFTLMIDSFIQLGIYPENKLQIDYSPVDHICESILDIGRCNINQSNVYNLFHRTGINLGEIIELLNDKGFGLEEVSYNEFYSKLKNNLLENDSKDKNLAVLFYLFSKDTTSDDDFDEVLKKHFLYNMNLISSENWKNVNEKLVQPVSKETLENMCNYYQEMIFCNL